VKRIVRYTFSFVPLGLFFGADFGTRNPPRVDADNGTTLGREKQTSTGTSSRRRGLHTHICTEGLGQNPSASRNPSQNGRGLAPAGARTRTVSVKDRRENMVRFSGVRAPRGARTRGKRTSPQPNCDFPIGKRRVRVSPFARIKERQMSEYGAFFRSPRAPGGADSRKTHKSAAEL